MGQISSALEVCRNAVKCLRETNLSNVHLKPEAQPHVLLPQHAIVTTQTALKASENAVNNPREANIADICPQHDEQSHISQPDNKSIMKMTSDNKRGLTGSGGDASSVSRSRMTKVASGKHVRTVLPSFPTEIILIVAKYLPPSSLMSLSYSCRNIHNKMGVSIEHSLGEKKRTARLSKNALETNLPKLSLLDGGIKLSLPTTVGNVYHSERLKLLCMLDRDQKVPPSKAVCSGCADTHDRSLFSSKSLEQSSTERCCLGSAGRLWICPHWVFDHNLVTTSAEPHQSHMCGNKGVSVLAISLDRTRPNVSWPITVLRDNNDAPSKQLVKDVLSRINIRVCKHLRIADAFVLRLYSPDCRMLRWVMNASKPVPYCQCSSCAWQISERHLGRYPDALTGRRCEHCGAHVFFGIRADDNGQETLKLVVRTEIREFRGCTDRAWIEQVTDPAEFEGLEQAWYAATNEDNGTMQDERPAR